MELTRKHPDDHRRIVGGTHSSLQLVWWFTPPALEQWLTRSLMAGVAAYEEESGFTAKKATPWRVPPPPEGVWP